MKRAAQQRKGIVPRHGRERKGGVKVLRRKRKLPTKVFVHQEGCPIAKVESDVEIPWSYEGDGRWGATCACSFETYTQPLVVGRVKIDSLTTRLRDTLVSANISARPPRECFGSC